MNKTKSKVLSLILASAMIVSSFSSLNFASAATTRETGVLNTTGDKDTLYLASQTTPAAAVSLATLLGAVTVETYDHDVIGSGDFVSYTHASGDRLVKINSDGDLTLKKEASGKEVITVTYEADYTRNDKDVVVRASKDITIYSDVVGVDFIAEDDATITTTPTVADRPDAYSSAAVNDTDLTLGVYTVATDTDNVTAKYSRSTTAFSTAAGAANEVKFSKSSSNTFKVAAADINVTTPGAIKLALKPNTSSGLTPVGSETLKVKLDNDTSFTDFKVAVAKKWRASVTSEVNKKSGTTYINKAAAIPDWDNWDSTEKAKAQAISGYEVVANTSLKVLGGTIGNVSTAANTDTVSVEDGTVGDIKANQVAVEGGSVGTVKVKGTAPTVDVKDGKVKAIDAKTAVVTIDGGTISGNVVGKTVAIDSNDEEIATTINGDVTAKDASAPTVTVDSSSDAAVKVTGTVKGDVTLSSENVTVGAVDADYTNNVTFDGFVGTLKALKNATKAAITVDGDSKVTVSGKVIADSVTIEDAGKLTLEEASLNSVDGDGTLAIPAGKLFIEDSMVDVTLQLTSGLVAGATAFQAYSDAVTDGDFVTLGYTLEQKSANSDVDKFVIKSVNFAGVQFDKSDLTIAKGQSSTLTVSAYPTATALPAGASIAWDIDANDDYITMTTEGNTATIKVVDFNKDYATDNKATITATVVDADGNEYDDYVAATATVTATALPTSTVTLDTTKPVTVGTGAVYQYIAKSSSGAVMTATSSDTQIATVELFNAADPRGYKFQVKGVAEGTATITTTDANGATATLTVNVTKVNGTLKADTTTYTFAPGAIYDVKFSTTGTTAVPVVTVNGKVVSIAPRGNGVYRVTAQNAGTAFVVATVGNTHVSVKFVVAPGAVKSGVTGNNVSILK